MCVCVCVYVCVHERACVCRSVYICLCLSLTAAKLLSSLFHLQFEHFMALSVINKSTDKRKVYRICQVFI